MKKMWILLYCIILCLAFPSKACAEEIVPERERLDVIFVIDCSGSMRTNDPSRIGLSMVQAFIDTVQAEEIRIGYVAYNNEITSYSVPKPIESAENREKLEEEINSIKYSGYTDTGLGVAYAYELLSAEKDAQRMIVLISDGEVDLPKDSSRTEEQSNQELMSCADRCKEESIQIYTVSFGQYEGSAEVYEEIAGKTGAMSYLAQEPENLIEVLYGIFQNNLFYQIQKLASGTYAGGTQEVIYAQNTPYLDEINILLLSSGTVGETVVQYGDTEIPLPDLPHYVVGKIRSDKIDSSVNEMAIRTMTKEEQDLRIYTISYRGMMPVLEVTTDAKRNRKLEYRVYFRDRAGEIIIDTGFYEAFSWELSCMDSGAKRDSASIGNVDVSDGGLCGTIQFANSGIYKLEGTLSDNFGSHFFSFQIEVSNTMPSGSIPEESCTLLERERVLCLDDYFTDEDGDTLSYSLPDGQEQGVLVRLDGNYLTLIPESTGTHMVAFQISDGEASIQYVYCLEVVPLWRIYRWVIVPVLVVLMMALMLVLWKLTHRPKPELERLTEEKKECHFCGKLDAYFILQPKDEEEIPPLSFQISRVKDSRVSLGDLFGAYPKQAEALQLHSIFLIADEKRSMILFHTSESGVMLGNTIACKQIQYGINFGDVVYITSPDGCYDLEIRYVAIFQ